MQVVATGDIEVVPDCEMMTDHLEEQDALRVLIELGYTDQQMSDFLRQRQDRAEVRAGERDAILAQDDHR